MAKFHNAMVVDGVAEDRRADEMPVDEEKYSSTVSQPSLLAAGYSRLTAALTTRFGTKRPESHEKGVYSVLGTSDDSTDNGHAVASSVWDN